MLADVYDSNVRTPSVLPCSGTAMLQAALPLNHSGNINQHAFGNKEKPPQVVACRGFGFVYLLHARKYIECLKCTKYLYVDKLFFESLASYALTAARSSSQRWIARSAFPKF